MIHNAYSDTKKFEKSVVIRRNKGSGKTFCILYINLYSIPNVLYSTGTARMCHRSLQMGTQHWNFMLFLCGNEKNVKKFHCCVELAVKINRRKPIVEYSLKNIYVIFKYELDQLSSK